MKPSLWNCGRIDLSEARWGVEDRGRKRTLDRNFDSVKPRVLMERRSSLPSFHHIEIGRGSLLGAFQAAEPPSLPRAERSMGANEKCLNRGVPARIC